SSRKEIESCPTDDINDFQGPIEGIDEFVRELEAGNVRTVGGGEITKERQGGEETAESVGVAHAN
ncbi:hypothetical protein L916_14928, partial [Phytophthora nicotianae]